MIRSGVRLHEQEIAATAGGEHREGRRRGVGPRWGVVNCPDGPHRVDLAAIRTAMTRLVLAGELGYDVKVDLSKKAGVSRSTISRMLGGRPTGLRTVRAVLGPLKLPFEDVISAEPFADALAAAEDVEA